MEDKSILRRPGSLFYGALLLTAGSVAIRLVQMVFQVYISGVMGAAGLGRMQLILTIGSFASIVASGGVRIAATCLSAEEAGLERASGVRTAIRCCSLYGLALSVPSSAILFTFAPSLSLHLMEDASAAMPLRVLAVFLPVSCLWSVLAGYYTAAGRITELVVLELLERLSSIGLVIIFLRTGPGAADPCTAVFLGSSSATLLNLLYLLIRYYTQIRRVQPLPLGPMMIRLLKLSVPLGFNDILRSGLSSLEHLMIPAGLRQSGSSGEEALASYGVISGMVFPVITFPSVILYSLSDLLVPEMSRSRVRNRRERIVFLTDKCLRLSLIFATAVAGLCFLLGGTLGQLLFQNDQSGIYIRVFSPLILILYLDAITDGILKGLSQQIHTVRYNTFTSLLDVLLLFALLPIRGIGGYLAAYTISHCINFFLSFRRLMIVTEHLPSFHTTVKCAFCCIISVMLLSLLPPKAGIVDLLTRGAGFLGMYLPMICLTGALEQEDVLWIKKLITEAHPSPASS